MSRFSWRGPNVPPDRRAFEITLPGVKHHAWAGVTGERRPAARPPAPPRHPHPGLLDDLPLPEGPIRPRRPALPAMFRVIARALGIGGRAAAGRLEESPGITNGCIADGRIGQPGAPAAVTRAPAAIPPERRLSTAA